MLSNKIKNDMLEGVVCSFMNLRLKIATSSGIGTESIKIMGLEKGCPAS